MADRLFTEINIKTLERYEKALESVEVLAGSVARMPDLKNQQIESPLTHPSLELMLESLDFYTYIFSTYIGYKDGSFFQVVAIRDQSSLLQLYNAPEETAYVVKLISPDPSGKLTKHLLFLNQDRQNIGKLENLPADFDPRTRPWYVKAKLETTAVYSKPYVFNDSKIPGLTCAEKLVSNQGVFGADITLNSFSASLTKQKTSPNGLIFLFDNMGRIIAHPHNNPVKSNSKGTLELITAKESRDPLVPAVVAYYQKNKDAIVDRTKEIQLNNNSYLVRISPLQDGTNFNQILASIGPVSDFTGHIKRMQQRIFLFSLLVLLAVIPFALFISRKISRTLSRLELDSMKIRQRDFSQSPPIVSNIKEIHSLAKAFDIMKETIHHLLKQQRKLFDDFTKLIAGAIDAKSPYTGGHCARVPVIAEMLAQAASDSKNTTLATFKMDTTDTRWEFEVAAWLHDCGKVTTPEYIVDKATKLETIYNRIHEIRMRFEVLLRDAEIEAYQKRVLGELNEHEIQSELEEKKQQIIDDYTFLATCNIGGEFMADNRIDRLQEIAAQTWVRHLDDRIGISQDEAALKAKTPAPLLPVVEYLLADKPEHIVPRTGTNNLEADTFGFQMNIPEHLYNMGELYNLGIQKGTLSPEDRFKINEHIIQTIIMLNRLDFPDYLKNVPEFAGAHHETMIGTGYPRGLKKQDMSIPARIMAIADIFEALTAADRPYKKPKTLNEALKIMSFMRDDQHIDADLFDLFLREKVFLAYATNHLDPSQIDNVDITQYMA